MPSLQRRKIIPAGQCLAMIPASWPAPDGRRSAGWPVAAIASETRVDTEARERCGRICLIRVCFEANAASRRDLPEGCVQSRVGPLTHGAAGAAYVDAECDLAGSRFARRAEP